MVRPHSVVVCWEGRQGWIVRSWGRAGVDGEGGRGGY